MTQRIVNVEDHCHQKYLILQSIVGDKNQNSK